MKITAGEYLAGDVGSTINFLDHLAMGLILVSMLLLIFQLSNLVKVVLTKVSFLIYNLWKLY